MKRLKIRHPLIIALIAGTVAVLMLSMLVSSVRASLSYGRDANVGLGMASLSVHLLENGETVDPDAEDALLSGLGGKADPGYTYKEEIAVRNDGEQAEFVRIIVKRYWKTADGEKLTGLDPSTIQFTYGESDYNTAGWAVNAAESTREQDVFYCRTAVEPGADSPLLFDGVKISGEIMEAKTVTTSEDGRTITAEYDHDGAVFGVDMEVQSVQAESAEDAIRSSWGVRDISVSGSTLSVAGH